MQVVEGKIMLFVAPKMTPLQNDFAGVQVEGTGHVFAHCHKKGDCKEQNGKHAVPVSVFDR
jgi:hypothetical protein